MVLFLRSHLAWMVIKRGEAWDRLESTEPFGSYSLGYVCPRKGCILGVWARCHRQAESWLLC